jgi:hypothetical protein
VEYHGGDPKLHSGMELKLELNKGVEVEAQIGNIGKFRKCVITKVPKHRRWFNLYDDVSKTHHRRIPRKLIRQVSSEDSYAHDVDYWIPSDYPAIKSSSTIGDALFPRKGEEVEIEYKGEFVRAQILKVPKHRRWFNVYLDDLKVPVNRVPRGKIRSVRHKQDNTMNLVSKLKPTHKPSHTYVSLFYYFLTSHTGSHTTK